MKDYHINIFYSDEDAGHIADIPNLEYCTAFGDKPEKALAELQLAKHAWIESAKNNGTPVPPPRYRPLNLPDLISAFKSSVDSPQGLHRGRFRASP